MSCNAEMQTHYSAICIIAIMHLCYASFDTTIFFLRNKFNCSYFSSLSFLLLFFFFGDGGFSVIVDECGLSNFYLTSTEDVISSDRILM
jgi:hypothetical protein